MYANNAVRGNFYLFSALPVCLSGGPELPACRKGVGVARVGMIWMRTILIRSSLLVLPVSRTRPATNTLS
jgi:hypothetical protein